MLPFQVIRDPAVMRVLAEDQRRDGRRICLVPTMGYLHEGHLSLLAAGRARSDILIVSIFVNPTQFGPHEDFDRYPRDEEGDLAKARQSGADLVFCPSAEAMYPEGFQTFVQVSELAKPLCGARRPGHFAGVSTVVGKLFHLTKPHVAVFGEKDYQQLVLLRRMVRDLDFDVQIVGCPIVREEDGLALSSRNAYLSAEERRQAISLFRGLEAARQRYAGGARGAEALVATAREPIDASPLARPEYVELRDAETLEPIPRVARPAVLAVAVHFGATRLIDNVVLR